MKERWNLIGRNFTHTSGGHTGKCGTHGKLPKNIEWVFNFESDISFYLDQHILHEANERKVLRKFGWLLESQAMKPVVYKNVGEKYESLFEIYEAIFTHKKEFLDLDTRFRYTICCGFWIKDMGIHPKSKLVSAISSGKNFFEGHRWRNQFIESNAEHFDLFGNKYKHIKAKEEGLNDYMFSVAIENGVYRGYFTEKFLDCLATGTVPIYRGDPDIGHFFNLDGIIVLDDNFSFDMLSKDLYHSKMEALKDNFSRLVDYHSAEDYIFRKYRKDYFN